MNKKPTFDVEEAHRYFSAYCFNKTWNYIEKQDRTVQECEEMLHTCLASMWHWAQRTDVTPKNSSVGYWQASRVHALLGRADDARRYGQLSLEKSAGLEPFYVGYAYEALARSEMIAGNHTKKAEYVAMARKLCDAVSDQESKKLLVADLDTIK